jgi:hypothetical protein
MAKQSGVSSLVAFKPAALLPVVLSPGAPFSDASTKSNFVSQNGFENSSSLARSGSLTYSMFASRLFFTPNTASESMYLSFGSNMWVMSVSNPSAEMMKCRWADLYG